MTDLPRLSYVAQADPGGCGVACLAMITDQTYAEVKEQIEADPWNEHSGDWINGGTNGFMLERYLARRGYFRSVRYETWFPEEGWPAPPFASIHYANVNQPSGNSHYVVMLDNGDVLDPLREGRFALTDWPKVNNVVGLVKPRKRHTLTAEDWAA